MVQHLERDTALLEDGAALPSDATLLITGATAEAWPGEAGLATDERGFIAVNGHLQSTSHPFVFAAGDVATFIDTPRPKSGVYAVRAGPPLAANLLATLDGRALTTHRPQRRALYLISTGPAARGRFVGFAGGRRRLGVAAGKIGSIVLTSRSSS